MCVNFIKISRKMLEWEWYSNKNTKSLFLHCLLKANWKDGKFEGLVVERGSFVTSIPKLSTEIGITQKEVRTALEHLKSTGELTVKSTNKYSIITVNNYCSYQLTGSQPTVNRQSTGSQPTVNRQSTGSQPATIEECKELKNDKNVKNERNNLLISKDINCQTDVRLIIDEWNTLSAYGIKQVSRIDNQSKRYRNLKARLKQYSVNDVLKAIDNIRHSDFLQGKHSGKPWQITFDWFVLPNNFPKVFEGNYDNSEILPTASSGNTYIDKINNRISEVDNWV